ncbi:armadillo repeat-containing protein 7-like isoform X2 [Dinothrombium tinctorium]|uniref:Armadillo repeat-containing protein 7-like isoform X2 n=1 Tax=Dinothrombium tinctorium TaxID=1965070 RepID=A0A443RLI5_9ACAR|nr:armadillo repeat-containing protein 7-like isoform X2 [Dinothrombium tinctorium]
MKRTRKVYCEKERFEYLKQLLHEFQVTKNNDAKRQVLANLANFCYDPINYDHMRKLNLISILLDLLSESNADIVEYAIAGLCNLSPDAKNVQIIVEYNGIDKIVNCIDEQKPQITISAITTLIHVINNIEPSFQRHTNKEPGYNISRENKRIKQQI